MTHNDIENYSSQLHMLSSHQRNCPNASRPPWSKNNVLCRRPIPRPCKPYCLCQLGTGFWRSNWHIPLPECRHSKRTQECLYRILDLTKYNGARLAADGIRAFETETLALCIASPRQFEPDAAESRLIRIKSVWQPKLGLVIISHSADPAGAWESSAQKKTNKGNSLTRYLMYTRDGGD